MAWAEAEEARERDAAEGKPPAVTQTDIDWMNKQIQQEKEKQGETFGEDISEEF